LGKRALLGKASAIARGELVGYQPKWCWFNQLETEILEMLRYLIGIGMMVAGYML